MTPTIEVRRMPMEVRMSEDGKTLYGRCVEYNSWSDLLFSQFRERILPGAFDESLANTARDVYCSFDHDRNKLLGRQSAGTLKLIPDERGIAVEVPAPPYSWAADLTASIQRGDLRGMSFIFDVLTDKWETKEGVPHRSVVKADLYEVSFVYFPAYSATEAGVRTAYPVAGEQRAIEACESWNRLERCRQRLRLLEASV